MKTEAYHIMPHVRRIQRELNKNGYKHVRLYAVYAPASKGHCRCKGCRENILDQEAFRFVCPRNRRRVTDEIGTYTEVGFNLEWWYCFDQDACLKRQSERVKRERHAQ